MRVLLGVTGGIAAYKAVDILRALQQRGAHVDVLMTKSARRFIQPRTFSSLTGSPVLTSLWRTASPRSAEAPIEHIDVAQEIDVLLVAPATAGTIARFAHGLASDLLSATYLATPAPVVIAPAMNVHMWQHPATQANLALLEQRRAHIVSPESGYLACRMTGTGRLASTDSIVDAVLQAVQPRDLAGETILVTAGGTREAIDPVRYIGNRSSGRMGYALAAAAHARGAAVILITASSLPVPAGVQGIVVATAAEMGDALYSHLPRATMVIAAAAVADFRPKTTSTQKLRREGTFTLHLEPTPDLLVEVAQRRRPETLVIGFAAETQNMEHNAREKLNRKALHAIVANDVSQPGIGFDAPVNAGLFITPDTVVPIPLMEKRQMADAILTEAIRLRQPPLEHASFDTPAVSNQCR